MKTPKVSGARRLLLTQMRGSREKRKRSSSASMDGCGAIRVPRNRRTMQAYPITKYAAKSIAQTSQTRSIGLIPAISAAGFAVLLVAKDGNGVSTSDMTPFACAVAGVCSRFQTLRCVGIVIGSRSRTAAAHQSAGKILRGRYFFKNSRSASSSRIIALPPKSQPVRHSSLVFLHKRF